MYTGSSPGPQVDSTATRNYSAITVQRNDSNCITCNFPANSTSSSCVIIISEREQTSDPVYGLLNITTYHLNRTGDTASGCLPDEVNFDNHNIAAFAFDQGRIICPPTEIVLIPSPSGTG